MTNETDLKVQILFEAVGDKELAKAFTTAANAQKKLDRATEKLSKTQRELARTKSQLSRKASGLNVNFLRLTKGAGLLRMSFATFRSQLLLASFAASLFSMSIGRLTGLFGEQEKAERSLSQAIGGTSTRLLEYASALQQKTAFGDEEIIQVQATLAQYTNEEEKLKDLTGAVLDFATAKNMDLKSASELVGKSIGSSTNALSRYGITIEGAVGTQERFNSAMKGLTKEGIAGQAEAQADTFTGRMQQAKNIFGDVAEVIGQLFVPMIDKIVEKFVVFSKKLLKQEKEFNMLKLVLKVIAAPFKIIIKLTKQVTGWFKEFLKVTTWIREGIGNFLIPIFTTLSSVLQQILVGVFNVAKSFGRFLVADIEGAKEAANRGVTAFANLSLKLEDNKVASEGVKEGMRLLNETTGGLIDDFKDLDGTLSEVNKKHEDNTNNLDKANRALLTHIDLQNQTQNALSKVAEKQTFLNQTTLGGELEHKSYVKTLADFNKAIGQNIQFTEAKNIAELEAFVQKTFQNEEERNQLLALIALQKELNDTVVFGMITDKAAREQKIKSGFEISKSLAGLVGNEKMSALIMLRIKQAEAIANAHAAAALWTSKGRPILAKLEYAKGILNAIAIEKQQGKVKSAALGADFITQGEQFLRVGDNPSGQERVQVTPLGNNRASAGGSGSGSVNVNINGNILGTDEFVRDTLIPSLEDSLGRNLA